MITREGEGERLLTNARRLLVLLTNSFAVPVVTLTGRQHVQCSLYDNLRFFRNAVGFISPHSMDFVSLGFVRNSSSLAIQLVPPKNSHFARHIELTKVNTLSLGHR